MGASEVVFSWGIQYPEGIVSVAIPRDSRCDRIKYYPGMDIEASILNHTGGKSIAPTACCIVFGDFEDEIWENGSMLNQPQ